MLNTTRSAETMLAVAKLRFTSEVPDHRAFLTSSNQASTAAFNAVWSLYPRRRSKNSRKVRRAMMRMPGDYHAPKMGARSRALVGSFSASRGGDPQRNAG